MLFLDVHIVSKPTAPICNYSDSSVMHLKAQKH